jgi:uncharacterized lipoprotein YmbA
MNLMTRCLPILLLVLCGCSLDRPYPSKELYVLPSSDLERVSGAQPMVLQVGRAHIAPPFDSRAFQYRVGDARYEPTYYAQWADDPGMLLMASVSRSIRSTGAFVVLDDASGTESPLLHLDVTDLYADVRDTGAPRAVVVIIATLLDAHGGVLLVWEDKRELPAASEQPSDIIAAWAEGVTDAVRELIPKLRAALRDG